MDMETPDSTLAEAEGGDTGECFYCGAESGTRCQCGQFYCSKQCLAIHRPGTYCLPFKVRAQRRSSFV